ncbi:hypothetical protein ACWD4L_12535 [Streptomyces sp. NPDC002596]
MRAAGALADEADRVSTATWGPLPWSQVQLDFFDPPAFMPPPDFLYVHRAQ